MRAPTDFAWIVGEHRASRGSRSRVTSTATGRQSGRRGCPSRRDVPAGGRTRRRSCRRTRRTRGTLRSPACRTWCNKSTSAGSAGESGMVKAGGTGTAVSPVRTMSRMATPIPVHSSLAPPSGGDKDVLPTPRAADDRQARGRHRPQRREMRDERGIPNGRHDTCPGLDEHPSAFLRRQCVEPAPLARHADPQLVGAPSIK